MLDVLTTFLPLLVQANTLCSVINFFTAVEENVSPEHCLLDRLFLVLADSFEVSLGRQPSYLFFPHLSGPTSPALTLVTFRVRLFSCHHFLF